MDGHTGGKLGFSKKNRYSWRVLFIGGMWFQDLFNYDFRRTEMCIIPYATQMGEISFCAYNTGVGWRKIIEEMFQTATLAEWYKKNGRHEVYARGRHVPLPVLPGQTAPAMPSAPRPAAPAAAQSMLPRLRRRRRKVTSGSGRRRKITPSAARDPGLDGREAFRPRSPPENHPERSEGTRTRRAEAFRGDSRRKIIPSRLVLLRPQRLASHADGP